MRTFIRTLSIALVGLATLAGPLVGPAAARSLPAELAPVTGGGPSGDSWIVILAPGVSPDLDAGTLARAAGGRADQVYAHAFRGFQFRGSATAADALRRNPQVISVTPDHDVVLTETLPTGIERISAYDNDTTSKSAFHQGFRGNGARIAVMDTGIDLDHPDLAGAIDQDLGKNCVTPALPPNDGYGHGTHVAGTAAAPLNGVGVVGV
ncbi:MAG TPA: S8 family serine peptidase, partial [bacterium]|nr:S8 family serine peptidase [bacterium]